VHVLLHSLKLFALLLTLYSCACKHSSLPPKVIVGDVSDLEKSFESGTACGVLLHYPGTDGTVSDFTETAAKAKAAGVLTVCATDLMALTQLKSPGEWGADIAVGNTQRFGVR
jgi:glycine dehydrogenase